MRPPELLAARIREAIAVKQHLLADEVLLADAHAVAQRCVEVLRADGAVYWCGNGGSAADAQHLAAELTGRYLLDRPPLRSEALHVNASYLTAVGNDYGFEQVYERLTRAQLRRGDVLIALSTSGNSANVIRALIAARELGAYTVGLTGRGGGAMAAHCDALLPVPSTQTPRIQEAHMLLGHGICELIERTLFGDAAPA